ncbi:hypothetical protein LPJ64_004500 [Coemansia asiatica]|uniref:Uncharacterized protein n=1 Tax=Coemansia asiatica TaxID=1052880 RepID=A0A9W7XIT5_9FUNG|nr:hypothetical protein LPJ64_004500 [Coemansia asiatica]
MTNISSEHSQLQRQLYLLGYSQPLPPEASPLASVLLRDLQTALDRVKDLEKHQTQLERDDRVTRATAERSKNELHALRTENNSLRAEILRLNREADEAKRMARSEGFEKNKKMDDLRMSNLRVRAEQSEVSRKLAESQQRLEEMMSKRDPVGRVPRMTMSRPLDEKMVAAPRVPIKQPPAPVVDLVELSSRRIAALEEEIDIQDKKLVKCKAQLKALEMEIKERDLEIMRLNTQIDEARRPSRLGKMAMAGDAEVERERLGEQMQYLHEQTEALERQVEEQREQFVREKDELHRRWVAAENERVRLAEQLDNREEKQSKGKDHPAPAPTSVPPANANISADSSERLRAECANIKSLYAQTRDQLQELLRSGNAETRELRDTHQALRKELDDLRASSSAEIARLKQTLAAQPDHQRLADTRQQLIAQLEQKLQAASDSLEATRLAHAKEAAALQQKLSESQSRQMQLEGMMDEYRSLVDQHKKLDRSLKQALAEVAEWRAKYDEREHRLSDLLRKSDEYRMSYKQASSELRTCRRTLETYGNDLGSLREATEHMQRENERLKLELDQTAKLKQAIEMSKDDYKRQLARALGESESHRSLVAHLQAERQALRVQVRAQFHLSQRLEQRLEAVDPSYSATGISPALDLPRGLSRSSSAAHSSRSFQPPPADADSFSLSTISSP